MRVNEWNWPLAIDVYIKGVKLDNLIASQLVGTAQTHTHSLNKNANWIKLNDNGQPSKWSRSIDID